MNTPSRLPYNASEVNDTVMGQDVLRRATIEDIPALCEARKRQLVDEGMQPDVSIDDELRSYFETSLANGTLVEWVLEEEGEVVATAAIAFMPFPPAFNNPAGTRGYVTNMYTSPSHRGKGVASRMLPLLMNEARQRGIHKVLLHTSQMGRPVYERQGFKANDSWMELNL